MEIKIFNKKLVLVIFIFTTLFFAGNVEGAMTTNLVSYWSFDSDATDGVGANHGTVQSGVVYTTSGCKLGGGCYNFSGDVGVSNGNRIQVADSDSLTSSAQTISAWINTLDSSGQVAGKWDGETVLYDNGGVGAGEPSFFAYNLATYPSADSNTRIDNGSWHFIVGTLASGTLSIYVDGVLKGTQTGGGTVANSGTVFDIGNEPSTGLNHVMGKLDEIGFWSRALNASEIAVLYNGGDGCNPDLGSCDACGAGRYFSGGKCAEVGLGYYSPAGDNSRYSCSAGYYGSTETNSVSTCNGACTAGYYCPAGSTGSTGSGQCTAGYYCPAGSSSATQNACGAGKYCPTGSSGTTNCAAGYYGSSTTNSVSTCNGACTAGYYCPAGSTSATQNVCGTGKYCPAGSGSTTACPAGTYGSTTTLSTSSCTGQCSAGYYGSSTSQTAATCNGQCTAGYYCTAGSTSATQNVCGTGKYCPTGSSGTTNCAAGYYGSSTTNSVSTCNGACTAGYYCTAGSTSATQNACTNKPLNSAYNSTSGTNSCDFSCTASLESKFGCATSGNNTNIHFFNNVVNYSNLTVKVGSKIYLNNSNVTISQLIMDGSGDKIIINSGSYLIINRSN